MWFVSFSSAVLEFEECSWDRDAGTARGSLRTGTRTLTTEELDRLAAAMRSLQLFNDPCVGADTTLSRLIVTTPESVEVLFDQFWCSVPAARRFENLNDVTYVLDELAGP